MVRRACTLFQCRVKINLFSVERVRGGAPLLLPLAALARGRGSSGRLVLVLLISRPGRLALALGGRLGRLGRRGAALFVGGFEGIS
jgi:hypothetical protein